ncbi:hypothetical protein PG991_010244 [Apiospora marii]|uniref:Uncharacterized protein n=1 Tax=Apiospora marii TaxID=335849 RepID=A0ABR1RHW4_9PEZI
MAKTASNKGRTARAPHKPLKPFPPSPHPPTYIAISANLTNYNPQPGCPPPECIDMGVAVFHGKLPEWSDERTDTSLAQLMAQAECHHVINKKHYIMNAPVRYDSEAQAKRPMLYRGVYAKTRILENEDEIKNWLWTLIQESQSPIDESKPTSSSSSSHHQPRNLVLMDWAASSTDRLLQRWGITDKLGLKRPGNDERVQFWDLRQWDRMAQLAPNPCTANPRDFGAPLEALGIDRTDLEVGWGLRDNAGNDAYLKLAIYLAFYTMTCEEEAAIMVTGKPLVRRPSIELEQDPEVFEANQKLYNDLFEARDPAEMPKYPPGRGVSSPEEGKTEETKGREEPGALDLLNAGWDSSSRLTFDMAPLVPTKLT